MPTARSIPSSGLRSSASITKMFTSSKIPAMMAKLPIVRNVEPRESPVVLALARTVCLVLSTEVPVLARGPSALSIFPATRSLEPFPLSTPPVLETKVNVRGCGPEPPAACAARTRVPGAKKASRVTLSMDTPATPRVATTRTTRTCTGRPYR